MMRVVTSSPRLAPPATRESLVFWDPVTASVNPSARSAFIQIGQLDVAHCDIKIGRLATPPLEME
jgi:hypothetical protein